MALTSEALKAQLNLTTDEDDALVARLLAAAQAHIVRLLGFPLDDEDEFPNGTPKDVEQAVLMLAAHWYENREATIVGVSAMPMPMGVEDIVREHRNYTFA